MFGILSTLLLIVLSVSSLLLSLVGLRASAKSIYQKGWKLFPAMGLLLSLASLAVAIIFAVRLFGVY